MRRVHVDLHALSFVVGGVVNGTSDAAPLARGRTGTKKEIDMSLSSLQHSRSRHISRACFERLEDRRLLSFNPATSFPVGTNPQDVVTADFNNDGKPDLATSSYDDATGDGSVSVLLGNGNGSFQPARTFATGPYTFALTAGDFNADGKIDLATAINGGSEINDVNWTVQPTRPQITISDVTKAEGKNNSTTSFTFTVSLSAAYDQPVTVSYRTVNGTATAGSDYTSRSGTVTFAPGQTTTTITIQVKGDNKRESNETFYLELFSNSSNSLLTKTRGIGTILNDD
jgi:hypothetical protein